MSSWAWMEGPGRAHPTPTPQLGQVWRPTAGVLSPSEGLSSQEGTPGWAAQSGKPHALCRTPVTPQGALGGQLPPAAPCKHTACEKPPARGRTRAVSSAAWRTRGPCLPPLKSLAAASDIWPHWTQEGLSRRGRPCPSGPSSCGVAFRRWSQATPARAFWVLCPHRMPFLPNPDPGPHSADW